jgi:hypothetical protein
VRGAAIVPDWADDVRDRAVGFRKSALVGMPGSAMKSWAETEIVNAAAKTAEIVIRITSPPGDTSIFTPNELPDA